MKLNKIKTLPAVILSILTILPACMSGCQRSHQASGGSVVGNGIIRYHDKNYDYFFEYGQGLDLETISKSVIRLNNKRTAGDASSEIKFSIVKLEDSGASSLESYASAIMPSESWSSLGSSHVKGLFYRNESTDKLEAKYIYQLNKDTLLDVQAVALSASDGITLISKVIASIDFDTTSPVIHEIVFEPAVATAGQSVKLKIRATDNMGSISGRSPSGSVSIHFEETCRKLMDASWDGIDTCSTLQPLGNDWYQYEIQTDVRMKEGRYLIYPVTIWDSAGNPLELFPDQERDVYRSNNPDDQTLIPLAYLSVTNPTPDNESPKLANVRFEPAFLTPGESSKLIFEATDNDPNFAPNKFCEKARHRDWFRFSRTDIPATPDIDPVEYSVSACSDPIKRPDGAWEVKITAAKGLPSGEYLMEFGVRDAIKNHSNVVSASLYIKNSDRVDLEGPKVIAIKTEKNSYKRGETGRILIKATDDISGIKDSSGDTPINLCRTGFVSQNRSNDDRNATSRIIICDNSAKHVEGDWYSIEFKLADNIPTGTYILPELQISDRVGNTTTITTSGLNTGDARYQVKHSKKDTNISLLGVDIVE